MNENIIYSFLIVVFTLTFALALVTYLVGVWRYKDWRWPFD
jgi:hypothetical protein